MGCTVQGLCSHFDHCESAFIRSHSHSYTGASGSERQSGHIHTQDGPSGALWCSASFSRTLKCADFRRWRSKHQTFNHWMTIFRLKHSSSLQIISSKKVSIKFYSSYLTDVCSVVPLMYQFSQLMNQRRGHVQPGLFLLFSLSVLADTHLISIFKADALQESEQNTCNAPKSFISESRERRKPLEIIFIYFNSWVYFQLQLSNKHTDSRS